MRAKTIILWAVTIGGLGGFAWSAMTAPATRVSARSKATTVALPASPEERPAVLDQEWTSRSDDAPRPATAPVESAADEGLVNYPGCNAVRAAGKAPLYSGQPGYRADMDGDSDGIACEPHHGG